MIIILEDNEIRARHFRAAAKVIAPDLVVNVWPSAVEMMDDLVHNLEHARLISLDHDLNERPDFPGDPGTGYDLVKFLCELIPVCPLIVHTSNAERGTWMIGELSRTGWTYERVYPFADDWIADEWVPAARRLLAPD